ncbi:MAG: choice-of-anchor tandem repeat GloVer-containing protein, partial [Candidatus Sulfotelmatobacter sp.]
MKKLLTSKSLRFAAVRSCRAGSIGTFSLVRTASLLFAFCIGAVIASPAQTVDILFEFQGFDGSDPFDSPVQGINGNFYGTTLGTIFEITPAGKLTTLHSFTGPDGTVPLGDLVLGSDGNFYGTTVSGGEGKCSSAEGQGCGTVFKITGAGKLTTLHSFDGTDGDNSLAGLVQASNGNFYGTTSAGGAYGSGTVFEITPAGKLTTLHSFDGTDGASPMAGLIQASNGNFYGTMYSGGAHASGTVFEITPAGKLSVVYSFCSQTNCTDGT